MIGRDAVIFLDMDGVLCTRQAAGWPMSRLARPVHQPVQRRPARAIDKAAVGRLNRICAETGALVVVSSMWRLDRDVPRILRSVGFSGEVHSDWRTDADGPTRGDEISRWLTEHGAPSYVVLDDKPHELAQHAERLVLVGNYAGLLEVHAGAAIALLTGGERGAPPPVLGPS